jgi:hypothetical protein
LLDNGPREPRQLEFQAGPGGPFTKLRTHLLRRDSQSAKDFYHQVSRRFPDRTIRLVHD